MKQRHAKKEVSGATVVADRDPAPDRKMSSGLTPAEQRQKWRDVTVAKASQRGKEAKKRGHGLVADKKWRRSILLFWYLFSVVMAIGVFLGSKKNVTVRRRAQLETLCEDRGRIISGLFKANSNHVKSIKVFIETLNVTNTAKPPSVLPSFSDHAPVCDFSVVPMVEERTVDEYVAATAFARPLVDRIAYCVRVLHANRPHFEQCMGFEITDYHTKLRRSDQDDYVVRTHVPNTTYLDSFDILSISDFHKDMLGRAKECEDKEAPTVSPPFPLLALNKMGLGLAFPVRIRESAPAQTAAERGNLTIGYMVGTVDFETSVELVISTVQQGSGKYDRIVTRLDDVSDPRHPIPLYEPQDVTLQSKKVTPVDIIPENGTEIIWTRSDLELLQDEDWFVYAMDFGDGERKHELRCQYEVSDYMPGPALLAGVGSLLIALLLLQVIWGAILRFESMREDYIHMAQLKQAADAGNTAKSVFLATMTHEIRTPLNGMLGMVNLLSKTTLDPMQLDYVHTAEESGRSLFYLINDVLDFAKIESGHLELEAFSFNMRSLVDEVLGALTLQAETKKGKVELAALVFDTVPHSVVGDPARLRQVLISLLGNALKFTERGHVFLTVRVKEAEQQGIPSRGQSMRSSDADSVGMPPSSPDSPEKRGEGRGQLVSFEEDSLQTLSGLKTADGNQTWAALTSAMKEDEKAKAEAAERSGQTVECNLVAIRKKVKVVFTIEDTGVGIPEGSKDRIFEPFQQLHSSMQRRYGGTGIGLALSHRLVELMGGSIDYVSKLRIGSTFTFDCQLDVFEKPKTLSLSAPGGFSSRPWPVGGWDPPSASKLSGKRAVIVDGGLVRQQVLATALRLLGLQVDICDSLYTALFAIQDSVVHSVEVGKEEKQGGGVREENKEWDLVLVDEKAAGPGTGIEFGQLLMRSTEVKNAVWRGGRVPKLLLVAYSLSDEETEVAQRGFFGGVVEKPIRSNVLVHTLQESLGFLPSPGPFGKNTAAVRQLQMLNDILKDKRVLVADDSMVSRKVTSATMLKLGAAAVVTVTSGQEAVGRMVPPHTFDCLFLDMTLPDMEGYEVIRRIRVLEKAAASTLEFPKRVPILGVMAEVRTGANVEGEKAGVDAYMQKPITEQELLVVLLRIFCSKSSDKTGGRASTLMPSSPRRGNADGQSSFRPYIGRSELSKK